MPSLWYVAAAYGVIWVVLLVYLFSIHQRLEALRRKVEATGRRSKLAIGRVPAAARAKEDASS